MSRFPLLTAASALALSGCGAGDGNDSANAANAMPESRTENGQITARGYRGLWEGPEAARFIRAVQQETFDYWRSRSGT
jgi:hypothetical protein